MQIVKAGGDTFIMLIVGLFWVVAQIVSAAAKKKPAPPRPVFDDEEEGAVAEDPFADLMRKLSGGQEFKIPPPPEPRPIAEPPPEPAKPLRNTDEAIDRPKPQLAAITAKPIELPIEIEAPDMPSTMKAFRSAMPSMKLPSLDLNFQTLEKTGGDFTRFGKIIDPSDKQSLKRAMLSHIIFSKPKAMEGWNTSHAG